MRCIVHQLHCLTLIGVSFTETIVLFYFSLLGLLNVIFTIVFVLNFLPLVMNLFGLENIFFPLK